MWNFKHLSYGTAFAFIATTSLAQEIVIKDNISRYSHNPKSGIDNQVAGVGAGQIIFSPHTFTRRTTVTRFIRLSNPTFTLATTFGYSVWNVNTPFTELFSGIATKTGPTPFSNVTYAAATAGTV